MTNNNSAAQKPQPSTAFVNEHPARQHEVESEAPSTLRSPGSHPSLQVGYFPAPIRTDGFWRTLRRWASAALAVRANLTAQEFLECRLAGYRVARPQGSAPLGASLAIEDGQVTLREASVAPCNAEREDLEALCDEARAVSLTRLLSRSPVRCHQVVSELQANEARLAACEAELDALPTAESEATATAASEPAPSSVKARPFVPSRWPSVALHASVGGVALFEGWQLALPYLNATGVDTSNLALEWQRNAVGVIMGGVFAVCLTACLFVFAHAVFMLGVMLYRNRAGFDRQAAIQVGLAVASSAALGVTAYYVASLRHGLQSAASGLLGALHGAAPSSEADSSGFLVFTLAVPLGGAILGLLARLRDERREAALSARREWEGERAAHRDSEAQSSARLRRRQDSVQSQRRVLEGERAELQGRSRRIWDELRALDEQERQKLDAETRYGRAYIDSVYAALMLDRHYFLRHARRAGKGELCGAASVRVAEQGQAPSGSAARDSEVSGVRRRPTSHSRAHGG